jgi:hypothetical protein
LWQRFRLVVADRRRHQQEEAEREEVNAMLQFIEGEEE